MARTNALRVLDAAGVDYELQPYRYVERGGAKASSAALGAPLNAVIKTLVMQDDDGTPLVVCMHGDREVSTRAVARLLGCKRVQPATPEKAQRYSGYQVGGTSPFGLRQAMPVLVESSILELPRIWINAGRRGLLVALKPQVLVDLLAPRLVEVASA